MLGGFAWLVAAATLFLVIAGGQVTSTDSDDAIPTWPLPLQFELGDGRAAFELGHRQVAAIVGLLTFALFVGVAFRRPLRLRRCRSTALIFTIGARTARPRLADIVVIKAFVKVIVIALLIIVSQVLLRSGLGR